jgi:hypothetical protein
VYQTKVQDVDELHCQITVACETVTPVMLQNTWQEVEYHPDSCWATKGAHVDIYRKIKTYKLSVSHSAVPMFLALLV